MALVSLHALLATHNLNALKARAEVHLKDGRTDEAIQCLRLYRRGQPEDDHAARLLGIALAQKGQAGSFDHLWEARDILAALLREAPEDRELRLVLLDLYVRLGDGPQAVAIADVVFQDSDLTPSDWRLIADAFHINKRRDDAVSAARKAVDADPTDLISQGLYLPMLWERRHDPAELKTAIDAMLHATRDRATAELLAYTVLRNANLDGARRHLEEALRLGPENVDVLLMAASNALERDAKSAGEYLARAETVAPKDARVLLSYGKWLSSSGQLDESIDRLIRGLELDGAWKWEFTWRAVEALAERRRFDEGAELAATLADSGVYQPAYRYVKGRLELLQGKRAEAAENLTLAEQLLHEADKSSPLHPMRDELAYKIDLSRAGLAYANGDLDEAIRRTLLAHERLPHEAIPLTTLGELYFAAGDMEASAKAWSEAKQRPFAPSGCGLGLARSLVALESQKLASERNLRPVHELLSESMAVLPNDPNIPLLEAEALWLEGKLAEALAASRAAAQRFAGDPNVLLSCARLAIVFDDTAGAMRILEDMDTRFERRMGSAVVRVAALTWQGEYDAAQKVLDQSPALFPNDAAATASRLRAQIEWLAGRSDVAGKQLDQAYARFPQDELVWVFRWSYLAARDDWEGARRMAESCRDGNGSTKLWRWSDALLVNQPPSSGAATAPANISAQAAKLRQEHPIAWQTWHLAGLEAEQGGESLRAARFHAKALATGPAPPILVERLIKVLLALGQTSDAEAALGIIRRQRLPLPQDATIRQQIESAKLVSAGN